VKAFEQDDFIQTTLVSGSVALRDSAQRLHYLKPNEQALWERRNGSVQIRSVDASVYTAWVDGYFSFNQTSLEQVMQQVGHWYGKDVLYLNARHKKTRYTGSVRMYDSIQDVLRKFELAGNLAFDMDDQCIRVQRK
jgi:ferric-dicitrate binding protein FerR (iron transport regulator)